MKTKLPDTVINALLQSACTISASEVARANNVSTTTVLRWRIKTYGLEWTTLCRTLRIEPSQELLKDLRNPYLSSREVGARHGVLALRVRRARVALGIPCRADVVLPYRSTRAPDSEMIAEWQTKGTRPFVIRNTGLVSYYTACTIAFARYSLGLALDLTTEQRQRIKTADASIQELAVEFGVSPSVISRFR